MKKLLILLVATTVGGYLSAMEEEPIRDGRFVVKVNADWKKIKAKSKYNSILVTLAIRKKNSAIMEEIYKGTISKPGLGYETGLAISLHDQLEKKGMSLDSIDALELSYIIGHIKSTASLVGDLPEHFYFPVDIVGV